MYDYLSENGVVFSTGSNDSSLQVNSSAYTQLVDAESVKLKNAFFAVFIHGLVDRFVPGAVIKKGKSESVYWTSDDFFMKVLCAWAAKGGNRGILLLSCYAGCQLTAPLAKRIRLPIVAPRSAVTVMSTGEIECQKMSDKSPNTMNNTVAKAYLDWNFVSPSGQQQIVSGGQLNKSAAITFVKRYRTL